MHPISTGDTQSGDLPFSEAIVDGERIYVSGQVPVDPETGEVVGDTPGEQTARTLENVERILSAADASMDDVCKATLYLTDVDDYDAVNEAYREFFGYPYPARTAVEVSGLALDVAIEIDVVATMAAD